MNWQALDHLSQLDIIHKDSALYPTILFKHSTSCSISHIAQRRLMHSSISFPSIVKGFYLDLLKHRDISQEIAHRWKVHHESPQVLLISNGDCVYESSHLDIQVEEIIEQLEALYIL